MKDVLSSDDKVLCLVLKILLMLNCVLLAVLAEVGVKDTIFSDDKVVCSCIETVADAEFCVGVVVGVDDVINIVSDDAPIDAGVTTIGIDADVDILVSASVARTTDVYTCDVIDAGVVTVGVCTDIIVVDVELCDGVGVVVNTFCCDGAVGCGEL